MSTWCPMPWMFHYVRTNGDYRVCCHQIQAKAVVRSEDGRTMNVKTHSVEEFRNSAEIQEMREQLLDDEWPESCKNCRTEEEAGLISRRQTEARRWSPVLTEGQCRQSSLPPVLGMELRLGNKCNLKCRMCHPRFSSAWYQDFVSLWGNKYPEYGKEIEILRDGRGDWTTLNVSYDWPLDQEAWRRLMPLLEGVRYIYISGGEPLLIEDHFKLLEKIISLGRAKEVTIEMASNLTVVPVKALELWPHFKRVGISASFDGVGGVNDYIRFPSKWENVERNLHTLNNLGEPVELWVQPCVQALNVLDLAKIYEWRMGFKIKNTLKSSSKSILNPLILQDPKYLSVQV
ncbi:MAG: twitch domain-containing radical SAM protein, partial [Bdellovibrionales bacterium]|nr:twitch domain-containing radical SAM protein [Bdellovibrionales bacterium]